MRVDLEKVEKALEIGHKAGQADTDLERSQGEGESDR